MIVKNSGPKGKWLHTKINGYTEKVWLAAYSSLDIPYVKSKADLNLNAHEEAIIHVEEKFGIDIDGEDDYPTTPTTPPIPTYSFEVNTGSNGDSSMSGSSLDVQVGTSVSFDIYPDLGYEVSTYDINNVDEIDTLPSVSASSITTSVVVTEDTVVDILFS